MLALAWPWGISTRSDFGGTSARLGASLCAGIGGYAGVAEIDGVNCAYRALQSTPGQGKAWRPATLPDGRVAIFHGYFDNATAIAAELGADRFDLARLYALAVEQWGDQADLHIIGDYCAVIADPKQRGLRLARSPLRAPPL